ncbi:hypothetical protein BC941DRAFT_509709 [Chlamydoabsidia padenii]|nr:hypothetical protein BC941DRAFT_509709 [Chlamydoabsidia padenii]
MEKSSLHSRILSKLADTLSKTEEHTDDAINRFISKCPPVPNDIPATDDKTIFTRHDKPPFQWVMTTRCQEALEALIEYTIRACPNQQRKLLPRLLNYVRYLQVYDWSAITQVSILPDVTTYQLFSGLLCIGACLPDTHSTISSLLWSYKMSLLEEISGDQLDAEYTICFILPSLIGTTRALQLSPFVSTTLQLNQIYDNIHYFTQQKLLTNLQTIISPDTNDKTRRVLAKYWDQGEPLTSNRIIYDVMILFRNILARNLASSDTPLFTLLQVGPGSHLTGGITQAWTRLLSTPVTLRTNDWQRTEKNLKAMYVTSMDYYQDLRNQFNTGGSRPCYSMEIMGTCLHVASLASISLRQLDDVLISHIIDCLFEEPLTCDSWRYVAALDSAVLLAINFQQLNGRMTQIICQFLTTPRDIFDIETDLEGGKVSLRKFAVTRLAQCLKALTSTDVPQAANSVLYSLLNEITHYDHGDDDRRKSIIDRQQPMNALDERQNRQLCVNVLSAIIGVAVHLEDQSITSQALSMLLLEKKSFSVATTPSVLSDLVDLALVTSMSAFEDILGIFSMHSREYLQSDDRTIWATIVETQLVMAQRISVRPDLYQLYLTNILSLFIEHGTKIKYIESDGAPVTKPADIPLVTKLGTLLPILKELLQHDDFNPQDDPLPESVVSLYRNFWILCVLFGFVGENIRIEQWHEALLVIAHKSPILILDSAKVHLEMDLEYNSILRGGNHALTRLRQDLVDILPTSDIRGFSTAQVILLLSVYHIETRRSYMGNTGYILKYFMNESISCGPLEPCLEGILDCVLTNYIKSSTVKALEQSLGDQVGDHFENLLPLCCHRLEKVQKLACMAVDRIVHAFPQVFAEKKTITLLLELSQLLWISCYAEYRNEYMPIYHFTSKRVNVTIELGDSFDYRRMICNDFSDYATKWLMLSLDCCPMEVNGLLQDYLAEFNACQYGMDAAHMGRTIALRVGKAASNDQVPTDYIPNIPGILLDDSSNFANGFTSRIYYTGRVTGLAQCDPDGRGTHALKHDDYLRSSLEILLDDIKKEQNVDSDRIRRSLLCTAAYVISKKQVHSDMIKSLVQIPVMVFTSESIQCGTDIWNWMMIERPDLETSIMIEILVMWTWAQRHRKGMFSPILNFKHPFEQKMTYEPSDTKKMEAKHMEAVTLFTPHETWLRFIISRFFAIRHKDKHLVHLSTLLLRESFQNAHLMSTHPMSRLTRFQLLYLGMQILCSVRLEALEECNLRNLIYETAYNWFGLPPCCRYGSWKTTALIERNMMKDLYRLVEQDNPRLGKEVLGLSSPLYSSPNASTDLRLISKGQTKGDIIQDHASSKKLLLLLLENEIYLCTVWCNPLNESNPTIGIQQTPRTIEKSINTDNAWKTLIRFAWTKSPRMAIQLSSRFKYPIIKMELNRLIANNTLDVVGVPKALEILLGDGIHSGAKLDLRYLKYWAPVSVVTAINYFSPMYGNQPMVLQYAMRCLEYYPVDVVFFYVPQLVQTLRHDEFGYVECYILKAGQVSQLFAHQIIWNMQANFYLDADKKCEKPDPMKPSLERIITNLVTCFDGEDQAFYQREFKFFGDITAISGYLKEYIKFGQNEKKPMQKKRLDEELEKIKVDVGVYLPSNPDGHVVDISRTSGRPLQSHAKAPFMATFLIEKEQDDKASGTILQTSQKLPLTSDTLNGNSNIKQPIGDSNSLDSESGDDDNSSGTALRVWQGAIFKVGDDCRQDVLALQLIAVFKSIFTSVGLDLYVYPYRVVATGPGMGVIDVIPQSISRDQLGREKVNSLYDYFVAKYGNPSSIHFQRARINFVQSLAAYSVVSFLLQIKDRHNGNIMLDDKGHLVHIDFGFIFDIAPGGGILESSPFKLTSEMIQVMGNQSFKQFSELVVKAYLASRPYAELIMQLVRLMLESGLPCFKGDTMRRMQTRFQLDKSDRGAADYMVQRIGESFENQRTVLYDYFQKITNGIPY